MQTVLKFLGVQGSSIPRPGPANPLKSINLNENLVELIHASENSGIIPVALCKGNAGS